jgi:hypothetical protein
MLGQHFDGLSTQSKDTGISPLKNFRRGTWTSLKVFTRERNVVDSWPNIIIIMTNFNNQLDVRLSNSKHEFEPEIMSDAGVIHFLQVILPIRDDSEPSTSILVDNYCKSLQPTPRGIDIVTGCASVAQRTSKQTAGPAAACGMLSNDWWKIDDVINDNQSEQSVPNFGFVLDSIRFALLSPRFFFWGSIDDRSIEMRLR